jgi:predicted HTH transcriptional regulator
MTPTEAEQLIAAGENDTVELKSELSSRRPRDICKEIAALATMQGGHLFVGVHDDGAIAGLDNPEEVISQIENWVAAYVAPAPIVTLQRLTLSAMRVVYVRVSEGAAPLYYYDGRPYLRVNSASAVAAPHQVEYLLSTGKLVSELRAQVARMASLETTLNPARRTAAAIMGQGELATMNYEQLRARLLQDIGLLLQAGSRIPGPQRG